MDVLGAGTSSMELIAGDKELEALNIQLNDPTQLAAYKGPLDTYRPHLLPRVFGSFLVFCGNLVYGREPSYLKFRAVEIIARVPYHSWSSAAFTLLTLFFSNEKKALRLSNVARYSRIASDNETMHVVVISQLARKEVKAGYVRHTLVPMLFAFFYFWASYWMYLIRPRWSYELNYLFESHAFAQYDRFLELHDEELRHKAVESDFLAWYGRTPIHQYDFFRSVRNDEIVHRNQSIHDIDEEADLRRIRLLKRIALFVVGVLLVLVAAAVLLV
ncbi:MAG: Oxidase [Parcubacteria bacterium C7867-001]|nr:MAG: Oxidase [Parcubacteria bacterium C7867-001]